MAGEFVRVASLAEIPEGEVRPYELPGAHVAVVRIEGEVLALADECTHQGCALSEGEVDESEEALVCPCHGSAFDVRSGEPVNGPAVDPVPVLPARVVDGWVEVAAGAGD